MQTLKGKKLTMTKTDDNGKTLPMLVSMRVNVNTLCSNGGKNKKLIPGELVTQNPGESINAFALRLVTYITAEHDRITNSIMNIDMVKDKLISLATELKDIGFTNIADGLMREAKYLYPSSIGEYKDDDEDDED